MTLKSRKYKKTFVLIYLTIFFLNTFAAYSSEIIKMSNDKKSFDAAQLIGKETAASDVAVMYRGKTVLAAVLFDCSNDNKEDTKLYTEQLLKDIFPNAEYVYAAVDDGEAIDILELAYYINAGISDTQLIKRFNSLAALSGKSNPKSSAAAF